MSKDQIVEHVSPMVVMADRASITVIVRYPGIGAYMTTWQGSAISGYPGPVLWCASDGKTWHRVDSPERFGDTFGPAWIEAFYA